MMVNTCPVRSLLTSASFSIERTLQQSGNASAFVSTCPLEGRITQATLLDISKLDNNNSLPLPFILTLLNIYLFASILNTRQGFFIEYRDPFFLDNIALFLKNRSILI
ncbi:MAG TPA: hypothetical protein VL047_10400 [Albibacterium sp.]|nr:hypothetical protein [Albibacterium sp.]